MLEIGEIKGFKHGDAENLECDIVGETSNIQIEVITEFKAPFSDLGRMHNPDMIFLESLNTETVVSKSLMKKLFEKNYSDNYETQTAIFTIGYCESILEFTR